MYVKRVSQEFESFKKEFYKIYWDKINPILSDMEKGRASAVIKYLLINSLVFVGGFTATLLFNNIYLTIFLAPSIIFVGLILAFYMYHSYSDKLKKTCMPKIMKAFNDIKWKNRSEVIGDVDLSRSFLFGSYDVINPYDAFVGKYKDIDFVISELGLKRISGASRYEELYPDLFRGVVVKFPYNKSIKAHTIVVSKNDKDIKNKITIRSIDPQFLGIFLLLSIGLSGFYIGNYWDAFYGRVPLGMSIFMVLSIIIFAVISYIYVFLVSLTNKQPTSKINKNLKSINLEDVMFNKKFTALSQDEVEGRYLLTPVFIERFQNLEMAFRAKSIKCSFNDGNLIIVMSTGNVFEIGNLFKKLDDPKNFENFFDELISVLYMIDYFKLDENTGL